MYVRVSASGIMQDAAQRTKKGPAAAQRGKGMGQGWGFLVFVYLRLWKPRRPRVMRF